MTDRGMYKRQRTGSQDHDNNGQSQPKYQKQIENKGMTQLFELDNAMNMKQDVTKIN